MESKIKIRDARAITISYCRELTTTLGVKQNNLTLLRMEHPPWGPSHPLYLREYLHHLSHLLQRVYNEQDEMRRKYSCYYNEYVNLRHHSSSSAASSMPLPFRNPNVPVATVIFRGDVPRDATAREIEQPFRTCQGFMDLDFQREVAGEMELFVKFDDVNNAIAARDKLHEYIWDRKKPSRMITENRLRAVRIISDENHK